MERTFREGVKHAGATLAKRVDAVGLDAGPFGELIDSLRG
jgi:hypothetical protein